VDTIVRYAEGMSDPTGFVHARCAPTYFGADVSADRLRHFVPALAAADLASLAAELSA
jgi:hypothetical protein